jgi:hypothetical protein
MDFPDCFFTHHTTLASFSRRDKILDWMNGEPLPDEQPLLNKGDKRFVCIKCDKEFVFTAAVQKELTEKGLKYTPERCKPCTATKNDRLR